MAHVNVLALLIYNIMHTDSWRRITENVSTKNEIDSITKWIYLYLPAIVTRLESQFSLIEYIHIKCIYLGG